MDPVPPGVATELAQILSDLTRSDNKIRVNAEKKINERLAQMPDLYLLALAQFSISADNDVMRSFSFILLRRFLFRPSPLQNVNVAGESHSTLYDHISSATLTTLESILLHSLSHEPSRSARRSSTDTITTLANYSMQKGRAWLELHVQALNMTKSPHAAIRESAFRVFTDSTPLVTSLKMEDALRVLKAGLEDDESIDVRFSALCASMSYITSCDAYQQSQALSLLYPMLETLPSIPSAQFSKFLSPLMVLALTHPTVFQPHLQALLTFMAPLILSDTESCSTPTEATPIPNDNGSGGSSGGFTCPPQQGASNASSEEAMEEIDEDAKDAKKAALELMISLTSAKPGMVKNVEGWSAVVIRACLEGMSELADDGDEWLEADPADDPTEESFAQICEETLDRLASALGGKVVFPLALEHIPRMLSSYDWQPRHAGLMAIAAIVVGFAKTYLLSEDMESEMQFVHNEMGNVVNLVTPMFNDPHPRVRCAACYCIGQLCTDQDKIIQNRFGEQFFNVLIPTLQAPEPRVHLQAALALSAVCEGVGLDLLTPYLGAIVECLLKLLNATGDSLKPPKRYVQEQAITTLAAVAGASKITFTKYYPTIMPLLLDVIRNANGPDFRKLRAKAMECAGLTAIAVGRDVFHPDANALVELLVWLQNGAVDPGDAMLNNYLIKTWAKICQTMGSEFEPFLPVVMPPLLDAANADIPVDDEHQEDLDMLCLYDDTVDIPTSAFDEKCEAFETIAIYCSTLQAGFAPYLAQCFQLTLPSLNFIHHEGVREACYKLLPMLLYCCRMSNILTTQMVSVSALQLINCIGSETEAPGLVSLFKCFINTLEAIGGPTALPQESHDGLVEVIKIQLQSLANERVNHSQWPASEFADAFLMMGQIEDYALIHLAKLLYALDPKHPLLVEVWNVKNLGLDKGAQAVDI